MWPSVCLSDWGADECLGENQAGTGCHQSTPRLYPAISGWKRSTPGQPPDWEEETARRDLGDEVSTRFFALLVLCYLTLVIGKGRGWKQGEKTEKMDDFGGILNFLNYCFGGSLCTFSQHLLCWDCTPTLERACLCSVNGAAYTDVLPRSEALLNTVLIWVLLAVGGSFAAERGLCWLLSSILFGVWLVLVFIVSRKQNSDLVDW